MKTKIIILLIGISAIIISIYNIISGESIKSNLVGFIFGIVFILSYNESNKSDKLKE